MMTSEFIIEYGGQRLNDTVEQYGEEQLFIIYLFVFLSKLSWSREKMSARGGWQESTSARSAKAAGGRQGSR